MSFNKIYNYNALFNTRTVKKTCHTLEFVNISSLCSSLCDETPDVYGLAEFGFPQHLIPKDTNNYIAYFGVRKKN